MELKIQSLGESDLPDRFDIAACKTVEQLSADFYQGVCETRERLAKAMLDKGFNPSAFTIAGRMVFDEKTSQMHYECFPLEKGAPDLKATQSGIEPLIG